MARASTGIACAVGEKNRVAAPSANAAAVLILVMDRTPLTIVVPGSSLHQADVKSAERSLHPRLINAAEAWRSLVATSDSAYRAIIVLDGDCPAIAAGCDVHAGAARADANSDASS